VRWLGRIAVVARKELRQVRRDRLTIGMMLMIPMMQLLLFGYAIDTDVRHMPTVVIDGDGTAQARDLLRRLEATGFYDITARVATYEQIAIAFRSGQARVGVVIPDGFAAAVIARRPASVQLVIDGSDAQTVSSAQSGATAVVEGWSAQQRATQSPIKEPISLNVSIWYNPDLRTAVYIVPGLVGVILTMTLVMFTAMGIARERERGTLEQLIVSPVRSIEIVIGKIIPYLAIGFVQMTIILVVGVVGFDVPFAGSPPALYLLATLFIAACLALGLFFSTLAKTQMQAMQMSFFFFLPQLLLSGFIFPFEGMPHPAQWLGQAMPLTHFLRIIRGIVLKGAAMADLAPEIGALGLITAILVTASALRFRKKLG
jgi:ABC-2 type transport system permease protein